ncbi:bursicon-like [Saccostrea cucullata]|uniref:bursicon-like n=1 Tax=Saccostrea cuccullata TaxID=36930 RepID=UPI002ED52C1C
MPIPDQDMLLILVFLLGATSGIIDARCGIGFITVRLRPENCKPKQVLGFGCRGTCTSYTKPSYTDPGSVERFCECCREGESIERGVLMECHDGTGIYRNVSLPIRIPTSCSCRPCSALPGRVTPGEEELYGHRGGKRSEGQQRTEADAKFIIDHSEERVNQLNEKHV